MWYFREKNTWSKNFKFLPNLFYLIQKFSFPPPNFFYQIYAKNSDFLLNLFYIIQKIYISATK